MKKLLEIILCILHPIAVVLVSINLLGRTDIDIIARLTWGIAAIVPFVPFVYVLTGNVPVTHVQDEEGAQSATTALADAVQEHADLHGEALGALKSRLNEIVENFI
jgi:hypothetical protein